MTIQAWRWYYQRLFLMAKQWPMPLLPRPPPLARHLQRGGATAKTRGASSFIANALQLAATATHYASVSAA